MVGLASDIPLSRRVQLAVLAHIRHTHTRYDQLLKEMSWMNARKVVEPVCLDVLVKWRGDEETGRDQMEEILREVVVITDSEDSDTNSEEEDSSEEEGELNTASSASASPQPSHIQLRSAQPQILSLAAHHQTRADSKAPRDRKAQRGFKRYQAAWDEALTRQQHNRRIPEAGYREIPLEGASSRVSRPAVTSPHLNGIGYSLPEPPHSNAPYDVVQHHTRPNDDAHNPVRQVSFEV